MKYVDDMNAETLINKFNIFGILSKTIDIMMSSMENVVIALSKANSTRPDYLIKPDRYGVGATDFDIGKDKKLKLIESGYVETEKIIKEKLNISTTNKII